MSVSCENLRENGSILVQDAADDPHGDVAADGKGELLPAPPPKTHEAPPKKRKTRRGKSKRKHPYIKSRKLGLIKPEAPHNSNQFLLEDHGLIQELDENLKCADQRTRDSSFSVDSEGEFYSSPDDEEQFLIKDFADQYQSVQAEYLLSLTKAQLIEEYQQLENRVEVLSKRSDAPKPDLQREVERLRAENERLRRENDVLRTKNNDNSDSEDSETDSSDSCSSTSKSSSSSCSVTSSRPPSPTTTALELDYPHTNGHTSPSSIEPV